MEEKMTDKMKELEEKRRSLMFDLYVMEHKKEVELTSCIESKSFLEKIKKDWRFWSFYNECKHKYSDDINIEQFYIKELLRGSEGLYRFIIEVLMDLPEQDRPQKLYINEEYPFKLEIIDTDDWKTSSFNDFDIETSSIMMNHMIKAVPYLTDEEIKTRMIRELTFRINLKTARLKKKQAKEKPKKIKYLYKYDKDEHLEKIYKSRAEACEKEGFSKSSLSNHLKGLRQTLNGFIYKEVIKEEE